MKRSEAACIERFHCLGSVDVRCPLCARVGFPLCAWVGLKTAIGMSRAQAGIAREILVCVLTAIAHPQNCKYEGVRRFLDFTTRSDGPQ